MCSCPIKISSNCLENMQNIIKSSFHYHQNIIKIIITINAHLMSQSRNSTTSSPVAPPTTCKVKDEIKKMEDLKQKKLFITHHNTPCPRYSCYSTAMLNLELPRLSLNSQPSTTQNLPIKLQPINWSCPSSSPLPLTQREYSSKRFYHHNHFLLSS